MAHNKNTQTFDNVRRIKPFGFEDVDQAFFNWFNDKLDIHVTNKDGNKNKIKVIFVSSERWFRSREEGIRNKDGSIVLPIIAMSRIGEDSDLGGPLGRAFADTHQEYVYAVEVDKKSSEIKNLLKDRKKNIDPDLPIYQIYTFGSPNHQKLTYEVSIWASMMEEMNEIMQKLESNYDFKSVKSFTFPVTEEGFNFTAMQTGEIENTSNLDDFTDDERKIQRNFTFEISAHLLPQSNEKRDIFKRYWSQTKIVFKEEVSMNLDEFKEKFGK